VDKTKKNSLPWHHPLKNLKTNFRLIIYSRSSTEAENAAKIDEADVEIIGLTKIGRLL